MKLRLLFLGWTVIFSVLTLGAQTALTGSCGNGTYGDVSWVLSDDRSVLTFSGEGAIINLGPTAHYPFSTYHGYNGVGWRAAIYLKPIPFSDDVPVSVIYEDGVTSTGVFFSCLWWKRVNFFCGVRILIQYLTENMTVSRL